MPEQNNELLEILLREGQASAPQPWYPADYAEQTGVVRATIDADLDRLRLAGLLRLSDWVQGKGQGYLLTPEGGQVLENPRLLKRLRTGGAEPLPAPAPLQAVRSVTTTWERGEAVRSVLLNPAKPIVTRILLGLNILMFLVGMGLAMQRNIPLNLYLVDFGAPNNAQGRAIGQIRDQLGAVSRQEVILGEWWRLLGYCFVHGGLLHIVLNMYFLFQIGPMVETMFGSVRYLILYLISGLGGGVAIVLAGSAGVGASGALCGLLASMVVWVLLNRPYLPPQYVSAWLRNLTINIVLIVFISMMPGISAAGHFGGGLAGAVVTLPLVYNRWGHGIQRWLGLAGVIASPLICIGLIQYSVSNEDRSEANFFRFSKIMLQSRNVGEGVYDNYAKPLLEKDAKDMFADKAEINQTLKELNSARDKLQSSQTDLKSFSFPDPSKDRTLEFGRKYLASWIDFLDSLIAVLNRGTSPTLEESRSLQRQRETINDLTSRIFK